MSNITKILEEKKRAKSCGYVVGIRQNAPTCTRRQAVPPKGIVVPM